MRALITGINGFLAGWLAKTLITRGAEVTGIYRRERKVSTLKALHLDDEVNLARGTVTDLSFVEDVIADFEIDTVFHVAALARVSVAQRVPYACFENNIRGTYSVLEACRKCDVGKVVVASTDKVLQGKPPCTESMPVGGKTPYVVSKACVDLIARSYWHTYGLRVIVTRCCNLYGPADFNFSRLIPSKIVQALKGEKPTLYSGRTEARHEWLFVEDGAAAYLFLAEKGRSGEAYNIGSGYTETAREILRLILEKLGREKDMPTVIAKDFKEPPGLWVDSSRIARLGWKANVSLEEGIQRTIAWYRQYLEGRT